MNKIDDRLTNFTGKWQQWHRNTLGLLLLLIGICFPFWLVQHIDIYYQGDVEIFRFWANCWGSKIYLNCTNPELQIPNYPVIGLTLSAGVIHAIQSRFDIPNTATLDTIFRYYLALFDALNFILLIGLAQLMRFQFPIFLGLLLLAIPSTWVGGAAWGQIDNIALFFALLSTFAFLKAGLVRIPAKKRQKVWRSGAWLLLGTFNLSLYILTKQLAVFSLPFFLILFLIAIWKLWKFFDYQGLIWGIISLILLALSFHYFDSLLDVPAQFFHSSYWYVWQVGSPHGDKISGNGFNLWMFLGRDMLSSSHVPFLAVKMGSWNDDISPNQAGIFLYSIFLAFLLFTGLRSIIKILKGKSDSTQNDKVTIFMMALLCLFHGLSHLGFNVLLSGTHERYLYLGYPFLLIAIAWFYINIQLFSWRLLLFCFLSASAYGGFVFSQMGQLPDLFFPLRRHEFLASIHLFLLLVLLDLWIRLCRLDPKRLNSSSH